jgi:ComF family protein
MRDGLRSACAAYRCGVDLLLPPRCVLCEVDLDDPPYSPGFCAGCRTSLLTSAIDEHCQRCGLPLPENLGCRRCAGRRLRFTGVTPLGVYEGALRDAVLCAKNLAGESLAAALGGLLAERLLAQNVSLAPFDLVAPVPSYWWRRLRRGTNEAAVLSQVVAERLRMPEAGDLMVCRRDIQKQSELNTAERRKNVRGAFRKSWGYNIAGAKILLVDDVLTTGATANEIARVLVEAGAASVSVAVVCRALGPDW